MTHSDPIIIGLSGVPGSGKDEIARHMVRQHGFVRLSFADAIREDLLKLNPSDRYGESYRSLVEMVDMFGWEHMKREFPSIRRLLQDYGKMCRDVWGHDCWIRRLDATRCRSESDRFVITDVRYENEIAYRQQFRGELWYVERPGYGIVNNHESEQFYAVIKSLADRVINNNAGVEQLAQAIDGCLESMWSRYPLTFTLDVGGMGLFGG